jgi:hypothetical protein
MEPPERAAADGAPGSAGGPPGFGYVPGFLGEPDHRELVARLMSLPFHEVRMRGVAARRTVVHFGWDYG